MGTYSNSCYKPELDESFRKVIGISRAYPGFKATGSEIFQELFKGKSNPQSVAFRDAQKALTAYSNDLLQYSTDVQGSRVLKFVQELLEKYPSKKLPISERWSAQKFGLETVFAEIAEANSTKHEIEWFWDVSDWNGYREYMASNNFIQRPSKSLTAPHKHNILCNTQEVLK